MKKIIYYLGVVFLVTIIILNIIFTARIENTEHIIISYNSITYIIGVVILGSLIFFLANFIDEKLNDEMFKNKKKVKNILLICIIGLYIVLTVLWIIFIRPEIGGDQIHVVNLAQTMYRENLEEFFPNETYAKITLWEYVEKYTQQIPLAFVYNMIFRIIHFDEIGILRALNAISACGIIVGIYKIGNHISKKHKVNKSLLLIISTTFIAIPMLTTFVYGDIPGLFFCIWSVYFTMKYIESKKIVNIIISAVLMMFGYMMRMNSLIFAIATVMYLILNVYKDLKEKIKQKKIEKEYWKQIAFSIGVIIVYIAIILIPPKIITNYYINKYNFDKNKSYPTISWIYVALSEGPRANGWYTEKIGEYALKNPEKAKQEYPEKIKERLEYFSKNPRYTLDFYIKKIASMWSENTYSAVWYNLTDEIKDKNIEKPVEFYQKSLILMITICSLIVIIQNRKNISLEVLFLVTIFIGGFLFHILWEAKSRYIIPYIIILIPIAAINVERINIKLKLNKEKNQDKEKIQN